MRSTFRPSLELLEDRLAPSVLIHATPADGATPSTGATPAQPAHGVGGSAVHATPADGATPSTGATPTVTAHGKP
jgi:hypothetical protein